MQLCMWHTDHHELQLLRHIISFRLDGNSSFIPMMFWMAENFTKFNPDFSSVTTYHEFVSFLDSGAQPDSETPGHHNKLQNPKFTGAPKKCAKIISKSPRDLLIMGRAATIGWNILLAFIALHALILWQPAAATRSLLAHHGPKTHHLHWVVIPSPISTPATTPPSNTALEGLKE